MQLIDLHVPAAIDLHELQIRLCVQIPTILLRRDRWAASEVVPVASEVAASVAVPVASEVVALKAASAEAVALAEAAASAAVSERSHYLPQSYK